MQNESGFGIEGMDEAVAACKPLAAAARAAGVPVIYTRQMSRRDGRGVAISRQDANGNRIGEPFDENGTPAYYLEGSPGIEVVDELAPQPGDIVVDKQRNSAFYETNLDLLLRGMKIDNVIIGGFVTDACMVLSAFDAWTRDYSLTLVKDICAASNEGSHQAALLMLANWVYDIEVANASEVVKKVSGETYSAWVPAVMDSLKYTPETMSAQFARFDDDATVQAAQPNT